MGKICSKEKKDSPSATRAGEQKMTVVIKIPEKDHVYTRDKEWVGLKNLHNTCFINSVLQCFSAINIFMGYLQHIEFIVENSFTESLKNFLL